MAKILPYDLSRKFETEASDAQSFEVLGKSLKLLSLRFWGVLKA